MGDNEITCNIDNTTLDEGLYDVYITNACGIDDVLRPLGWKRTSSNELYDTQSTMIQKIMTYEALGLETF